MPFDPFSLATAGIGAVASLFGGSGLFKSQFEKDQENQTREDWGRKNNVYNQYQGLYAQGINTPGVKDDAATRMALVQKMLGKQRSESSRSAASQMSQRFGSTGGVSGLGMAAQNQVNLDYNLARDTAQLKALEDALNTKFQSLGGSINAIQANSGTAGGTNAQQQSRFDMLGSLFSTGAGMMGWGANKLLGGGVGPASGSPAPMNVPNFQLQMPQTSPMQFWNPK